MKRLIVLFLILVLVFKIAGTIAESSEQDVMIQSILTGTREGDGTIVTDKNSTTTKPSYKSPSYNQNRYNWADKDHPTPEEAGWSNCKIVYNGTEMNQNYKYSIVDDGTGPTIIYFAGSGDVMLDPKTSLGPTVNGMDLGDTILNLPSLQGYNVVVYQSATPDIKEYNSKTKKLEIKRNRISEAAYSDLRGIIADKFMDNVFGENGLVPNSKVCVLIGHSLGGHLVDASYSAIKRNHTDVKTVGAIYLDGLTTKKYGENEAIQLGNKNYLTINLENDNVPMYILASNDDRGKNSKSYPEDGILGGKNVYKYNVTAKNDSGMTKDNIGGAGAHMGLMFCNTLETILGNILKQTDTTTTKLKGKQKTLSDKLNKTTDTPQNKTTLAQNIVKAGTTVIKKLTDTVNKMTLNANKTNNKTKNTSTTKSTGNILKNALNTISKKLNTLNNK